MENKNIIDFQEIDSKIKTPETREEIEYKKEIIRSSIERAGIRGFFHGQTTPNTDGITLDYDVEEVKKELGGAA